MLPPNPSRKRWRPSTTSLGDDEIQDAIQETIRQDDTATEQYLRDELSRREKKRDEASKLGKSASVEPKENDKPIDGKSSGSQQ